MQPRDARVQIPPEFSLVFAPFVCRHDCRLSHRPRVCGNLGMPARDPARFLYFSSESHGEVELPRRRGQRFAAARRDRP